MKLSKMVVLSLAIVMLILMLMSLINWLVLNTFTGKLLLVGAFIGIWAGLTSVIATGKPKES